MSKVSTPACPIRSEDRRLTDVQHTDELLRLLNSTPTLPEQALIHHRHEVLPHARIHELGDTVPHDRCRRRIQRRHDLLTPRHELLLDDPLLKLGRGNPEQTRRELEGRVVVAQERLRPRLGDLDVSEVEESGEKSEDLPLLLNGDADSRERLLGDVELGRVVDAWDRGRARSSLVEVEELGRVDV